MPHQIRTMPIRNALRGPGRSAVIMRNGTVLALVVAACNRLALPEGLFLALGVLIILGTDRGGSWQGARGSPAACWDESAVVIAAGLL